jgi:hypothetical protein
MTVTVNRRIIQTIGVCVRLLLFVIVVGQTTVSLVAALTMRGVTGGTDNFRVSMGSNYALFGSAWTKRSESDPHRIIEAVCCHSGKFYHDSTKILHDLRVL